jgi:hypothetical protein
MVVLITECSGAITECSSSTDTECDEGFILAAVVPRRRCLIKHDQINKPCSGRENRAAEAGACFFRRETLP